MALVACSSFSRRWTFSVKAPLKTYQRYYAAKSKRNVSSEPETASKGDVGDTLSKDKGSGKSRKRKFGDVKSKTKDKLLGSHASASKGDLLERLSKDKSLPMKGKIGKALSRDSELKEGHPANSAVCSKGSQSGRIARHASGQNVQPSYSPEFSVYYGSKIETAMNNYIFVSCTGFTNIYPVFKDIEKMHGHIKDCYELGTAPLQKNSKGKITKKTWLFLVNMSEPLTETKLRTRFHSVDCNQAKHEMTRSASYKHIRYHPAKKPFKVDQGLTQCDSLTSQIQMLSEGSKLCENRMHYLYFVTGIITSITNKVFGDSRVMGFGSTACGIAQEGHADLDISATINNGETDKDNLVTLYRMFKHLKGYPFGKVIVLTHCRVPIVILSEDSLQLSCDISLNNESGLLMAQALYLLNTIDERFSPLVLTIKYWAKVNRLHQKSHFSSHILTMLVVMYLQVEGVLPPIQSLIQNKDDCNNYYKTPKQVAHLKTGKQCNTGDLLIGFFEYFSKSPFRNIVYDVHSGTVIHKPHMHEAFLPDPHISGTGNVNMCRSTKLKHISAFQSCCEQSYRLLNVDHKSKEGVQHQPSLRLILPVNENCNGIIGRVYLD